MQEDNKGTYAFEEPLPDATNDGNDPAQLHFRCRKYLKDFLREWAAEEGKTMSQLVLGMIHDEYLRRQQIDYGESYVESI